MKTLLFIKSWNKKRLEKLLVLYTTLLTNGNIYNQENISQENEMCIVGVKSLLKIILSN